MSIFPNVPHDLFQQILTSLDAATNSPHQPQSQNSMIVEINKLAADMFSQDPQASPQCSPRSFPQSSPPNLQTFEEASAIRYDMAVGTQDNSYFELPEIQMGESRKKGQLAESQTSVPKSIKVGIQKKRAEADMKKRYGKIVREENTNNPSHKEYRGKGQLTRLYDQAKSRMIEKKNSFVVNEANKRLKEIDEMKLNQTPRGVVNATLFGNKSTLSKSPSKITKNSSISKVIEHQNSRSTEKANQTNKLVNSHISHSLENSRSNSIYDRGLEKLSKKQKFVTEEKQRQEAKELNSSSFAPRINNSMEMKKGFFERMSDSMQKAKVNKTIIAKQQLAKTSFKPKISLTSKQVNSKVKALWTKKPSNQQVSDKIDRVKQQTEHAGKSLNTTFTDLTKNMLKASQGIKSRAISVRFSQDFDYLLRNQ